MGPWPELHHHELDMRDADGVAAVVEAARPQVVFHLAAQPLVRAAYSAPGETYDTNVIAEEYVEGRELYVGVVGNERLHTFPIWELNLDQLPEGAPRIATANTHGTGCTLSAAIAARLALGDALPEAVRGAKLYLTEAIRGSYSVGRGHGPVGHFHSWRRG